MFYRWPLWRPLGGLCEKQLRQSVWACARMVAMERICFRPRCLAPQCTASGDHARCSLPSRRALAKQAVVDHSGCGASGLPHRHHIQLFLCYMFPHRTGYTGAPSRLVEQLHTIRRSSSPQADEPLRRSRELITIEPPNMSSTQARKLCVSNTYFQSRCGIHKRPS